MKTPVKILFGVLAATVVTLLIVTVVLVTSGFSNGELKAFSFDDAFSHNFSYQLYHHLWISENEYIRKTSENNLIVYNVETGETSVILGNASFNSVNATNYIISSDRKFLLLESNYKKQWRYSYTASYHIYDIENGRFVTENELPPNIQYIYWAPKGHKLVYVLDNNIYLVYEPGQTAVALTNDGKENEIYNGIPDWVYEELMLGGKYATWWSPNGKFIAYVQFNDTEVPTIEYSFYGEDQYPRTMAIPYPKAGMKNPTVKLFIVKVDDPDSISTELIQVPSLLASSDYYFSWVTWVLDERLSVQWLPRSQNISVISICDFKKSSNTWVCPKNREHFDISETGWIGVFFPPLPVFTSDNVSYYQIISDRTGYKHIHHISDSKEKAIPITHGNWEAIYIYLVTDEAIYYTSNEYEGAPGRRHIYRIGLQGHLREKQCITCNIRKERCQYYTARFSHKAKYYTLYCYGPGLPIVTLHEGSNDREIRILEDNADLEATLHNFEMPSEKIGKIVQDDKTFWYKMTLPPHFNARKKYPLLIYVYGGPSSQEVKPSFSVGYSTYLASTEGIIVASLDGRGTAYQGDKFMHAIYKRLGTVEVEDQIFAARKFIAMGFIDEKRIAIWGWSYGGYVTSMVLGQGTGLFKCGMAVAPVSNWEYYASIYTERYMGLPTKSDNLENYKNSTVMTRAEQFRKVDYLLVHGTADDNVHFQQAAQISKALVEAQVDFQAMWYTDKDHSISGSAKKHLFTHMTHFLKNCFNL
ncbi:fibroblast activation protein alpha L homeolog isoform X1 [Xenopus laevis]|uniref:Fibroblast activation protein alpha L homeolog isoform X1 n=5 Tax=Xenopus laevis TaxID=8355 RepID=A1L2R9_XENLA|nr:fibroblast activation protein alpha L homeolog isoform X1 [Xenopus laevis]AAI29682.1 Unknown (protein for MGC:160365) [Xenopus laevis]